MIKQFFQKIFKQFLQEKEEEMVVRLCFWIVFYYMFTPKFIMNAGGSLVKVNQSHEEYTYEKVEDFLREYNGEIKDAFCIRTDMYYVTFEEKIKEKCHELLYAYYFPRFIYRRSLLCTELLKEIGVSKDIEFASYRTLILEHFTEIKQIIHLYEETVLTKLFQFSFPLVVQSYCEPMSMYVQKEENILFVH
ncbi:hypothetical protein ACRS6Y_19945 [Bacillus cytotoxicus]|uniref:Uncharacterized protein n=2 Tax=Bacillus cytotoxicus TaxID=580165 RepID=A0AAX2CH63_9BACI|nr:MULTISPECIES: hypothetical protein [Bacillus cereus group]ABS22261.1 hypothetical protein Bcer98_1986 [Bacillus cytotoxicus NVH 391-98]AWC28870.1 hypothetical protein CG483_011300 [Bacillus cytotoxicus]AWC32864.1 hypothetical protein CG482_010905 [Bacillus cytotoxicus]AWC36890.1 hypothetical protein CG481_010920 [Bacillus cytotoxicus]AWC39744.1 hypothetical protein CG480_003955 [Bacillus cytotoxicus]